MALTGRQEPTDARRGPGPSPAAFRTCEAPGTAPPPCGWSWHPRKGARPLGFPTDFPCPGHCKKRSLILGIKLERSKGTFGQHKIPLVNHGEQTDQHHRTTKQLTGRRGPRKKQGPPMKKVIFARRMAKTTETRGPDRLSWAS